MKVQVDLWDDSPAVRLPKAVMDLRDLKPGSQLELTVEGGEARLRAETKTSRQRLEEMVAEMKRLGPENEPETVEWGPDVGSEIIDDEYSRGEIKP